MYVYYAGRVCRLDLPRKGTQSRLRDRQLECESCERAMLLESLHNMAMRERMQMHVIRGEKVRSQRWSVCVV